LIFGGFTDIYRQKLEQCVADGSLNDEDVSVLLRLRVLLCIPQETVDSAHADICGRLFTKVFSLFSHSHTIICLSVHN
jgi:hypothetical protein